MLDILIKGGSLIDGTGEPARRGDLGIKDGVIVQVGGRITDSATEVIEADGAIVTPGFIDAHTHYDAQASWDQDLQPSAAHGVTTAIMGNCGVGFAPVRSADHDVLIDIMEGVEDIPGTALYEGIQWDWESYPEYLAALGKRAYAFDLASQIPHAALRLYVMGDRARTHETATDDEIAQMTRMVSEGMAAGAVGFSTSRVLEHKPRSGGTIPGTFAGEPELLSLAQAVADSGHGVFQAVPAGAIGGILNEDSRNRLIGEVQMLADLSAKASVPVVFSLQQGHDEKDAWREAMRICEKATAGGSHIHPQVAARAPGSMSGFTGYHPFMARPTYRKLIDLPLEQRLLELRKPEIRSAILSEETIPPDQDPTVGTRHLYVLKNLGKHFIFSSGMDLEPKLSDSIGAIAAREGRTVEEVAYDAMLRDGGHAFIFDAIVNYAGGNYDDVADMMRHPLAMIGLSDAGAHVRCICDATLPTYSMVFWARDRKRGDTLPLEFLVAKQTSFTADVYGWTDRGRLKEGLRADVNVVDFDGLQLGQPRMHFDLPTGGARVLQGATGYIATLVAGQVARRNDADTGVRAGRLMGSATS